MPPDLTMIKHQPIQRIEISWMKLIREQLCISGKLKKWRRRFLLNHNLSQFLIETYRNDSTFDKYSLNVRIDKNPANKPFGFENFQNKALNFDQPKASIFENWITYFSGKSSLSNLALQFQKAVSDNVSMKCYYKVLRSFQTDKKIAVDHSVTLSII